MGVWCLGVWSMGLGSILDDVAVGAPSAGEVNTEVTPGDECIDEGFVISSFRVALRLRSLYRSSLSDNVSAAFMTRKTQKIKSEIFSLRTHVYSSSILI